MSLKILSLRMLCVLLVS